MLKNTTAKHFLPAATLRMRQCSLHPIIAHAIRESAAPLASSRSLSTVPKKTFTPTFSLLRDFDDFFSTPFISARGVMPMLRQWDMENDMMMERFFSPGYEISEDNGNVILKIDVPGIKKEDMNIEIKDGKLLHISGGRKEEKDGEVFFESKFDKRFTIDKNMDQSKISANLQDGVLTITAPKLEQVENVHNISITETAKKK